MKKIVQYGSPAIYGACRTSLPAPTQAAPKLEPPAHSSAVPGAKVPHPSVPMAKPKPGKSRAQLEGEERKRGPAGRTSMYKVQRWACSCIESLS